MSDQPAGAGAPAFPLVSTSGWEPGEQGGPHPYGLERAPVLSLAEADEQASVTVLRDAAPGLLVLHREQEQAGVQRLVVQADPDATRLVARLVTALPPLGARVLGDVLAAVATDHGPGAAAAVVGELERLVSCWAVVPSVSGLSSPNPSVRQHVRSYGRGTVFTVVQSGRARVLDGGPELPASHRGLTLVRSGDAVDDAVTRAVDEALGGSEVVRLPPLPADRDPWSGTGAELVQLSWDEVETVVRGAQGLTVHACPWCGTPGPHGACVSCGWTPRAEPVGARAAADVLTHHEETP